MAVINLLTEYSGKPIEELRRNNFLTGKASTDYDFNGVKGIFITSLKSYPLQNYDRTQNPTTGSRYGTPQEVEDSQQYLELRRDRSLPLTIDKGNFKESKFMRTVARVVKKQNNEQTIPEVVRYTLQEWAKNAGQYATITDDDDGQKILFDLLTIESMYTNAYIPNNNRFVAIDANLFPYIRSSLTQLDNITDRMLFKGVVGRVGTLNIIEVPHGDMPTGVHMLAWWKDAVMQPTTFETLDVHETPEGMDGSLINYHVRYDAFVKGEYANGVIAILAASQRATAVTPTSARVLDLNSGDTVKYTLDGTDPRYSTTAITVVADTTISSTAAPIGTTIKAVTYNSAKAYPSDVKSVVVAS